MAKTKQERITNLEEQILQLENQKKQLIQKQKEDDRKERTKRLCKRHGLLEKYMPDLITITDEQFEMFILSLTLAPSPMPTNVINSFKKLVNGEKVVQNIFIKA